MLYLFIAYESALTTDGADRANSTCYLEQVTQNISTRYSHN